MDRLRFGRGDACETRYRGKVGPQLEVPVFRETLTLAAVRHDRQTKSADRERTCVHRVEPRSSVLTSIFEARVCSSRSTAALGIMKDLCDRGRLDTRPQHEDDRRRRQAQCQQHGPGPDRHRRAKRNAGDGRRVSRPRTRPGSISIESHLSAWCSPLSVGPAPWRQDGAVVDSIGRIRALRTGPAHCARLHSGNRPAVAILAAFGSPSSAYTNADGQRKCRRCENETHSVDVTGPRHPQGRDGGRAPQRNN